jgi:hypothetical protein
MNYYDQFEIVRMAGWHKYKYLSVPMILIIISALLSNYYCFTRYITLISLAIYAVIFYMFSFNKSYSEADEGEIVSPINGKICNIEKLPNGNVITIKKSKLLSCEIVTASKSDIIDSLDTNNDKISWEISNNLKQVYFKGNVNKQCAIVGITPCYSICRIFLPLAYEVNINVLDKVIAGETVIAFIEV